MFKHYFEQIQGIGLYPAISLAIFFLFFLGLGWFVATMRKDFVSKQANLPLND